MRRIVAFALFLAVVGCTPVEPAFDNDPLVGGRPLPRGGTPPASPYNPAVAAASPAPAPGPVQLPPPTGPVSPAALTTSGSPSADASSLRIGPSPPVPGPAPGALTSAPAAGSDAWHGATTNAGAVLKGPEPITDGMVKPIAVIAPPTPAGPPIPMISAPPPVQPAVDSYGQLEDKLAQRGVLFQALDGPDDKGAWRFRCGVPSRDMPGATHNIEQTVAGDHGLAAMRAVIDQIDQYQRQGH